ncbi:phenylacetate--CoA ligase [Candidatus Borrarchaeum sp.]|uniref:phenylacetate--CoA ligase family protein n=1 Tax=Candidatus Borrarchaeum sp. TaxID=2846742 RepID=UPI00257FFF1A|nr:phenylacetate--CoA ligase [Candidatus Borrarchaeum sp.]
MIRHKEETLPKRELKKLQFKRLKETVSRGYEVPYYRTKMKEHGITPDEIRTLDDIRTLPFMTKEDFRKAFPFGLLGVPIERVVRIHATSGTTGTPSTAFYTAQDIDTWTELIARNLTSIGVTAADRFQNTVSHGLFTGGMGYLQGAQRVGAMVIPFGGGMTLKQLEFMRDFKVTSFHAIPSFGLKMAETAKKEGISGELSLRIGMLGAENWSEGTRKKIEEGLQIDVYDNYGLTELVGPGVSCECPEKNGMHVWEDHFLFEVLDPETDELLGPNEDGEMVLTALTKEAFPCIRFRTGDLCSVLEGDICGCGRTHQRISRIKGRIDDGFIIRGVNIFPKQIEEVIMQFPEIGYNYYIKLWTKGVMDEITVYAETNNFNDTHARIALQRDITRALYETVRIRVNVELVEEDGIPRQEGKAKRLLDEREEK